MTNVTATAIGVALNTSGMYAEGTSTIAVLDSFITGTPSSIRNNGSTIRVYNTRLSGQVSGPMTCIGAYDATKFLPLNDSCQ